MASNQRKSEDLRVLQSLGNPLPHSAHGHAAIDSFAHAGHLKLRGGRSRASCRLAGRLWSRRRGRKSSRSLRLRSISWQNHINTQKRNAGDPARIWRQDKGNQPAGGAFAGASFLGGAAMMIVNESRVGMDRIPPASALAPPVAPLRYLMRSDPTLRAESSFD